MSLPGYDAWLEGPVTRGRGGKDAAQDAYDLYLADWEREQRAEFDAGGHDFETWEEFKAEMLACEPPTTWDQFYDDWYQDELDAAEERRLERLYPGRI